MFEHPEFAAGTKRSPKQWPRAARSRSPAAATRSPPSSSSASAGKVSYISTGGGAFLEFLEGKRLPAVAVLEERESTSLSSPCRGSAAEIELLERAFAPRSKRWRPISCLPAALARDRSPTGPRSCSAPARPRRPWRPRFMRSWRGPVRGLVVTRYGHGSARRRGGRRRSRSLEAGHPSPDSASLEAGARLLELARRLDPERVALLLDLRRRLGACGGAADRLDASSGSAPRPIF